MSDLYGLSGLIGKTVTAVKELDIDAAELTFSDGSVAHFGMGCGNTPSDYPYFSCWVEDPKPCESPK